MIIELQIENFLRIKAVHIKPDGSLVQITGKNGQGKTSVLRAFEWVLGGKKAEPNDLIHHGADQARVALQIDDKFLIEKIQKQGKPTKFKVTSPDGESLYKTPQKLLEAFRNVIGFDPLEFIRMKPKERNEIFRKLLGIDFTDMDLRYDSLFAKRADAKKHHASLETITESMEKPADDLPSEPLSISDLIDKRDSAQQAIAANRDQANLVADADIALAAAEESFSQAEDRLGLARKRNQEARDQKQIPIPYDVDDLTFKIQNAESINKQIDKAKRRAECMSELADEEKKVLNFTHELEKIKSDKRLAIEAAEMPIEGLGYGDDGLLYNDVPIEQASQSEQLIISTAIGLKLNPSGIVLIRDGSLLDTERLKILEDFVESQNGLVIIERVTDGEAGVGIVIEDGSLASMADAAA